MVLRMPRCQAPKLTMTIEATGSTACQAMLSTVSRLKPGVRFISWARPSGKIAHCMVKAYQSSSATTAGVKALSITLIGVKKVSKKPPRRHADQMPMVMPMPKDSAVAAPTRNSVQPAA